jgi:hypothetical protein
MAYMRKPIGYVKVTTKSFLPAKSSLDNIKSVATCIDYSNTIAFTEVFKM